VPGPSARQLDRRGVVVTQGVDHGCGVFVRFQQLFGGGIDQPAAFGKHFGVFGLGHFVHLADRGARDDVVELVGQHRLPEPVELRGGVIRRRQTGAEEFGQRQHLFALAVVAFGAALGGERAAVEFQIEFADPGGQFVGVFGQPVEELVGAAELDFRAAFEIRRPQAVLDVFGARSAAAVADAEERDEFGEEVVLVEVVLRIAEPVRHQRRVVIVLRREVGHHLGVVDAAPEEGVVRELVELAPRNLLGEEVVAAGLPDDLRHGGGVTEHVRQPEVLHVEAEFVHVIVLAVQELADHRLAGDDVAVGFDPHAALKLPASFGDPRFDLLIEFGVVVADEFVEHRLRRAEHIVRVTLHVVELAGEGARRLADRFADRPEPADVDVGVPHRGGGERRFGGGVAEFRGEEGARGDRVGRVVGVGRYRVVERHIEFGRAIVVFGQGLEQRKQDFEVHGKFPGSDIEAAEFQVADCADVAAPVGSRRDFVAEQAVGGDFGPEVDLRSGLGRVGDFIEVFAVVAGEDAGVGESADGYSIVIEDEDFAAEFEFAPDRFIGPGGRNLAGQVNPGAVPQLAPGAVLGDRPVGALEPFLENNRLF